MNPHHTNKGNLRIIYEDNHLIVVNKRPGDLVQGDKTGDAPLSDIVKQFLKEKYDKPGNVYLGVAHRLDRPTSGVVLFAKTSKALGRLNILFAENKPKKIYGALVKDKPPKERETLVHYLQRKSKNNKSYAHKKPIPNSKKSVLNYKIIKKIGKYYALEINLKTGRHHQIRSQLSAIGCPIKGDLKYGDPKANPDRGIDLHAWNLRITHPVRKEEITFTASLPKGDLWHTLGT